MDRRQPDGAERNPGVGDPAALDPDGGRRRRDRRVAGTALDLLVGASSACAQRDPNLGEQLGLADGGRVRADVKRVHAHHSFPTGTSDDRPSLEGGADGRQVLGCIGLAKRAADRAAVADDRIRDHLLGVPKQREMLGEQVRLEQLDVARERADPDLATV